MIEINDVRKSYGGRGTSRVEALRGVSLSITRPGLYAVMGPSGSGKSTLLHLIAGLDRIDDGTIVVDGEPVHALDERGLTRYRRLRVGVIFQQFNLIPTMTALDNVALPGLLDGRPSHWLRERSRSLLESLGLGKRQAHRPEALSGGEQQRVAIARALLFEPKVVLADEPTGNLDSRTGREIWTMLRDLAERESMTVVAVTHEPAGAAYSREVFALRDGLVHDHFEVERCDEGWLANRYQQLER